ncbi:MAG: plastocyanin/azurin family copper-binding protein [Candidatus Latescibacter sp.]|nr:plastocyanin/azurin family copper-binding protein [Candidatus Latescibacter sp.]
MKTCACSGLLVFFGLLIQAGLFPLAVFNNDAVAQNIVQVGMKNFVFIPENISVTVGTTVKWTNQESFAHTATSGPVGKPDGIFDSGNMNQNATFSYVFQKAGVYPYYCIYHQTSMVGTVTVKPAVKVSEEQVIPAPVILYQNAPNPFNGETVLTYNLRKKGDITLSVYSMTGQKVWEQADKSVNPGRHSVRWSAVNRSGSTLSTGVYLYTLRYEGMVTVGRMLYLK